MPYFPPASSSSGSATATRNLWGPLDGFNPGGSYAVTTQALSDADNSDATIFVVPKDGTINQIGLHTTAVGGTGNTYNLGLVTMSGGNPSASAYGGSAILTPAISATGWAWYTLGTTATAVAGDTVAARIWPGAGTFTVNNITIRRSLSSSAQNGLPTVQEFAAAWTKLNLYPAIAVRYSDGTVLPVRVTSTTSATTLLGTSFNSGSTPDEQGAYFTVPGTMICSGAQVVAKPAGVTSTFDVCLYAGTVLQQSASVDPNNGGAISNACWYDVYWDNVTLSAGTTYRLTIKPTSANGVQIPDVPTPDADSQASWPEGARWGKATRTDAGAFTDTALFAPQMALWITSITLG